MSKDNTEMEYLRVGTSYFKIVFSPLLSGETVLTLKHWSIDCIKQDYGSKFLEKIPKYDGFCVMPNHLNYQQVIANFYNRYMPFSHKPKSGGSCTKTLAFLNHIFQHQIELGLDYLKLLLEHPTYKLPIICLISKDRNTGKTTFLMLLKLIFGNNMVINTNEDFRSNFNSDWTHRLIIGVDETLLDKREDSERVKNLATAKVFKSEAKGQDRFEVEFFAKFILCSNNEDNFIIIDPGETRYWVIKVTPLSSINVNLLQELEKEIPFFLSFLIKRPLSTENESRMWFNPKLLETDALKRVIRRSRNKLEMEIASILQNIIEEKDISEICFCVNDVQDWLNRKGFKAIESSQIKRILQNDWKLEPTSNTYSYTRYRLNSQGDFVEEPAKGRYYKTTKETIININD